MPRIGVWEGADGFTHALSGLFPEPPVVDRHPARFAEGFFDLLLLSPAAAGWAGAGAISAGMVLVPGAAVPLVPMLQARSAVSYGLAPKNSQTYSSLEEGRSCVALQRQILTLSGETLEEQEFVLPFSPGEDPVWFLALTGARLLLTGRP